MKNTRVHRAWRRLKYNMVENTRVFGAMLRLKYDIAWTTEKMFGGHVSVGPLTIFGLNAMHCAWVLHTKRYGSISVFPPLLWNGTYWPPHMHISPNGTPQAATFMWGSGNSIHRIEVLAAKWRELYLGHGYDLGKHNPLNVTAAMEQLTYDYFTKKDKDREEMIKVPETEHDILGNPGKPPAELVEAIKLIDERSVFRDILHNGECIGSMLYINASNTFGLGYFIESRPVDAYQIVVVVTQDAYGEGMEFCVYPNDYDAIDFTLTSIAWKSSRRAFTKERLSPEEAFEFVTQAIVEDA